MAVKIAGQHIEREMGLTMGEVLDPITGESGESLGLVIDMIFILMFLNANGHHLLLMIISKSYQAFPVGTMVSIPDLVEGVVKAGSVMLTASLRLAAPMIAAFLLLLIVLAVFLATDAGYGYFIYQLSASRGIRTADARHVFAVHKSICKRICRLDGQTFAVVKE
jgi:flagellar biosynthetic protein FliR